MVVSNLTSDWNVILNYNDIFFLPDNGIFSESERQENTNLNQEKH